ncbi:hypothetical protein J6590_022412 [Homalodisca vitripennis]|nr:hypothetical protein J6590_022412 [Homalodisca vitripennis]
MMQFISLSSSETNMHRTNIPEQDIPLVTTQSVLTSIARLLYPTFLTSLHIINDWRKFDRLRGPRSVPRCAGQSPTCPGACREAEAGESHEDVEIELAVSGRSVITPTLRSYLQPSSLTGI